MPCFTDGEVEQAHARIAMQQALGLDVRWLDPAEFDELNPAVAPGRTLGSSYAPGDGYIDPPRNVLAYTAALVSSGVDVREGVGVHRAAHRRRTGRRRRDERRASSRPSGWC